MTGLLVTGGEAPSRAALEPYLGEVRIVAAADSGLEAARRLGVRVDFVVGDMDSLSDDGLLGELAAAQIERHPEDKDETDTEIGLRRLEERGCSRVVIAGGGGGALDHFLGVLMLFDRSAALSVWLTRDAAILRLEGRATLCVGRGETLSFFPLGQEAHIARSTGLRWPLDGLRLRRGQASLRNRATSGSISVDVSEGGLLVVRDIREPSGGARQA